MISSISKIVHSIIFNSVCFSFLILTARFDSPFRPLQPHVVAHFISIRFNSLSVSSKPVIWFVCLFWFGTISESKLGWAYLLAAADEMLLLFCISCSKSMPWISSMYIAQYKRMVHLLALTRFRVYLLTIFNGIAK